MSANLKIIIATDNFLLLEGLRSFFDSREGFSVEYSASSSADLINYFKEYALPDILIIDFFASDFSLDRVVAYTSFSSNCKVCFIGDEQSDKVYSRLVKSGVSTLLSKELSQVEIEQFADSLRQGSDYVSTSVKKVLNGDEAEIEVPNYIEVCKNLNISEREIDIIKHIAEGFINKEIADKLFLSTHTVTTHRKNIMHKLGINNTAGIVLFAVKEGIVSPNDFLFSSRN